MHVSQRRIEANRRNAQKSTGPRTPEGKARVSQNSLKHGLYATKPILNVAPFAEQSADYESRQTALTTELCPATKLERLLVRRLANFAWQLDRAEKIATMEAKPLYCGTLRQAQGEVDRETIRTLTILVRRLCARLERTFGTIHSVKQSQYPDIVAELERSLANGGEDTETNPPLERVI